MLRRPARQLRSKAGGPGRWRERTRKPGPTRGAGLTPMAHCMGGADVENVNSSVAEQLENR